jgi:zinc transporter ZupT
MLFTVAFCCSPEGLATFVGYMSAPSTGVLIAVAIAMHK